MFPDERLRTAGLEIMVEDDGSSEAGPRERTYAAGRPPVKAARAQPGSLRAVSPLPPPSAPGPLSHPCDTLASIKMATARRRSRPRAQLDLALAPRTWGGRRAGAGRKPTGTAGVAHRRRPRHSRHWPAHVTLRLRAGLPSLRRGKVYAAVRGALARGGPRADFRVCHFSVQTNHVHLLCEADDAPALARGVRGLEIRISLGVNRAAGTRGRLLVDRYHARALKTPLEVRNALRYVLLNGRKHLGRWFDLCSSAPWLAGWKERLPEHEPWLRELRRAPPPPAPRTWLLSTGWRARHGPLSLDEAPAPVRLPTRPAATA
jgi:REP element-mobilizing transposase RayT